MKQLFDLEPNDCRYPMNDGGPYLFCAEAKMEGSSYCPFHKALCTRRDHGLMGRENESFAAALRKNNRPAVVTLAPDLAEESV